LWVIFVRLTRSRRSRHVRLAPIASEPSHRGESRRLCHKRSLAGLDHLVVACEQDGRNFEAERLRRLEIDDKLMFGSLLNGEVGWFSAPEDFIDVESKSAGEKLGLALDIVPSATREEFDVALVSMAQEKSRRSSRRAVTAHAYIMCALQQNPSLFDSSHRLLRSVSVGALAVFLRPAPRETRSLRTSVATYKD
jgi:hypothetical protein